MLKVAATPNQTDDSPLALSGLEKSYANTRVLTRFDLKVARGEVVALLGRNGAGKSTTVRLTVGLERPTAGTIRVFGYEPVEAAKRNLIGYCGQEVGIYPSRTLMENLVFFARIAGKTLPDALSAAKATAGLLGLKAHLERRSGDLSGGFKRRLHLGIALIGEAPLLVLDEPTAGVDVESRELIIDLVRSLAEQGRGILYTSHDLTEVERLCDRVTILSRGTAQLSGTVRELSETIGPLVRIEFEDRSDRELARRSLTGSPRLWGSVGLDVQLQYGQSSAETISVIQREGWKMRRFEVLAPGLEAMFLWATRSEDEARDST